jgi:hypothetical protein
MSQEALLAAISQRLDAAGIPFMVTGSHASSFHSRPRTTKDLDIVIDAQPAQLDVFVSSLGDGYYVSAEAAREALARRSMFNVIDFASGWKVDLIFRKNRPFSVEEFRRRQMGTMLGCQVPIASSEDVILSKLEWDKITESERQVQDALDVAVADWEQLDQGYMRKWGAILGVTDKLEMLLKRAEAAQ